VLRVDNTWNVMGKDKALRSMHYCRLVAVYSVVAAVHTSIVSDLLFCVVRAGQGHAAAAQVRACVCV